MNNWKKDVWKDVTNIGLMLLAIGGFVAFSHLPDDLLIKQIFSIIFLIVFGALILMFTPIGNPLKKLIRKYQEKKNE